MGVSVSFPGPNAPDPFKGAGVEPTVIYGASMNPIIIQSPTWPPIKERTASVFVGAFILLRVCQHPLHPSDLRWDVRVCMEIVATSNGYAPMNLEEAQVAAWDALARWLGAAT